MNIGAPLRLCAAVFVLGFLSLTAEARQMYRYINGEGNKVIGYQVPPEFVANGYEVLSATGAIIEVVPRTLDENERETLSERQRIERELAEDEERLRKWDESLLLRYSSVEDIEAARERALRDLRIRVSILKGKLRSLKQQVENYQAVAADQERLGFAVDANHMKAIDDLRSEISATERAVVDRQEEIAAVDANYDKDVERFTTLLDIVEMRRNMAVGG
ncbi:MAG: hypothetical protein AAGG55_02070 [Pseudomonadota bacterium]